MIRTDHRTCQGEVHVLELQPCEVRLAADMLVQAAGEAGDELGQVRRHRGGEGVTVVGLPEEEECHAALPAFGGDGAEKPVIPNPRSEGGVDRAHRDVEGGRGMCSLPGAGGAEPAVGVQDSSGGAIIIPCTLPLHALKGGCALVGEVAEDASNGGCTRDGLEHGEEDLGGATGGCRTDDHVLGEQADEPRAEPQSTGFPVRWDGI